MSLVDIRVDLPSYSRSFTVKVQPSSTVLQLKQEIERTCEGQPQPDGQRLIWRGRLLTDNENIDDLWKSDPRIVHLAVHPSAWSSSPPQNPQIQPQAELQSSASQFMPYRDSGREGSSRRTFGSTLGSDFRNISSPLPRQPLAFVLYKHQRALSYLCPSLATPNPADGSLTSMVIARDTLERNGWEWPSVLDEEFPLDMGDGAEYKISEIGGQPYLELVDPNATPSLGQKYSLRVLTYTFSILSMSLSATPTFQPINSQSATVPPNVNQLLQQLGMAPLRAVNNNGNPVVDQNNQVQVIAEIRQIPIRPLLAPLLMLVFRTMLLLYFVAPTRKPLFGILILAWMLYEIWRPIRNALNNLNRNNQPLGGNNARQGQNAIPPNGPPAPGANTGVNVPIRPGQVRPVTLDAQAGAIIDNLASMNVVQEQRILDQAPGTPTSEPGLGRKVWTFVSLFLTTLHPAIWNRRRVALRRREGVIRTEANVRNAPPTIQEDGSELTPEQRAVVQRRDDLRAQYALRPRWIQRYMDRVVAEDWVDDSD